MGRRQAALLLIGCCWMGGSLPAYADAVADAKQQQLEDDLCSPDGLMRLVPQLKNQKGEFEIPNPKVDLQKFLIVRQSLLNIIEMALTRADLMRDPYAYSSNPHKTLKFSPHWRAAEVGFVTDAKTIPDFSNGGFAYYGEKSFLEGITPVKGTDESFYTVPGSVVYINLMPTNLPCVNRIMETSGLNGGTMMAFSYVLGDKTGQAYLVVNGCQNTARTITENGQQVMAPAGSAFLGLQWAEK